MRALLMAGPQGYLECCAFTPSPSTPWGPLGLWKVFVGASRGFTRSKKKNMLL